MLTKFRQFSPLEKFWEGLALSYPNNGECCLLRYQINNTAEDYRRYRPAVFLIVFYVVEIATILGRTRMFQKPFVYDDDVSLVLGWFQVGVSFILFISSLFTLTADSISCQAVLCVFFWMLQLITDLLAYYHGPESSPIQILINAFGYGCLILLWMGKPALFFTCILAYLHMIFMGCVFVVWLISLKFAENSITNLQFGLGIAESLLLASVCAFIISHSEAQCTRRDGPLCGHGDGNDPGQRTSDIALENEKDEIPPQDEKDEISPHENKYGNLIPTNGSNQANSSEV